MTFVYLFRSFGSFTRGGEISMEREEARMLGQQNGPSTTLHGTGDALTPHAIVVMLQLIYQSLLRDSIGNSFPNIIALSSRECAAHINTPINFRPPPPFFSLFPLVQTTHLKSRSPHYLSRSIHAPAAIHSPYQRPFLPHHPHHRLDLAPRV